MSSGLNSTVANYGGRIGDPNTIVKQFIVDTTNSYATWNYVNIRQLNKTIATTDKNTNVLIYKDLTVEGAIINPSDEKLKENIEGLTSLHVDNLIKLNPVKYNLKRDKNKETHFGLIAQDVEKLYPELVHNDTNYKSINYIELIPILIEKMKQMQEEIDRLKLNIKLT